MYKVTVTAAQIDVLDLDKLGHSSMLHIITQLTV